MDYKIGDNVSVSCNSISIGSGVVESVAENDFGYYSYTIKLDKPIEYIECLTNDLELLAKGEK